MNILLAASELTPFVNGAIGRSVGALAGRLRSLGHEVTVALPLSRAARETAKPRRAKMRFQIAVGPGRYPCETWEGETPDGVRAVFLRRDEFFDRSGLYGNESGDYGDNAARFIFFSKAVVELARKLQPDAVGAHGWQAAMTAVFAKETGLGRPVVLTPHGLDFQGNFWSYDFGLTNLPGHYFSASGLEFYGSMNFLKAGILFSDAVVLPGELFANAAQTPAFGCGLENVLREQAGKIWGIPEGEEAWHPAHDPSLPATFSADAPAARGGNVEAFEKTFGIAPARARAVYLREAASGLGLLLASLDRLLPRGLGILAVGEPRPEEVAALTVAVRKHAGRFVHLPSLDDAQARLALAGTTFLVLPAPPEPLSPWLTRALAYGAAPVAIACDGLPAYAEQRPPGNAFLFRQPTPGALVDAFRAALEDLETNGPEALAAANMARDFSAGAAARAYEELFRRLAVRA